jgi:hypothetical protein
MVRHQIFRQSQEVTRLQMLEPYPTSRKDLLGRRRRGSMIDLILRLVEGGINLRQERTVPVSGKKF